MYKNILILVAFLLLFSGKVDAQILQVEPPNWWAGMKSNKLQLLIRGPEIQKYKVDINYPGIEVKYVNFLSNKNYFAIDLELSEDVKPGKFDIQLLMNNEIKHSYTYELKSRRDGSADREGYNSSDIIYLLMPDRFSNGNPKNDSMDNMTEKADRSNPNGRHGGDIAGIQDKLSYFNQLGVTALWINPLLENNMPKYSYHGYAITDFYKVDARFGSNEDYKNLVVEAHKKGLKIIQDMVFNHFGSYHLWMNNLPTKHWYNDWPEFTRSNYRSETLWDPYASPSDKKLMSEGWFDNTMPDLNQKDPFVANYLIQNSIWWIEFADLDGIRMDTYPYADQAFMNKWLKAVDAEYPNFTILGEVWLQTEAHTAFFQETFFNEDHKLVGGVESVTDFPLMYAFHKGLNEKDGWTEGLARIYITLSKDFLYAMPQNNVTFLDNHDVTRFATVINGDLKKYKMGLGMLLTLRGVPLIYYGTEIMMEGDKGDGDATLREDFPGGWPGDSVNIFHSMNLSSKQAAALDFTKKMIKIRQEHPALQNGSLVHYIPQNGVYVYFRTKGDEKIMIVLNNNDDAVNLNLKRFQEQFTNKSHMEELYLKKSMELPDVLNLEAKSFHIYQIK
jgi:glycosidase